MMAQCDLEPWKIHKEEQATLVCSLEQSDKSRMLVQSVTLEVNSTPIIGQCQTQEAKLLTIPSDLIYKTSKT